jgi:hypothetical protein
VKWEVGGVNHDCDGTVKPCTSTLTGVSRVEGAGVTKRGMRR